MGISRRSVGCKCCAPQNCQINLTLTGGFTTVGGRTVTTRLDDQVIHTGTTNFSGGLVIPIPTVGVEYEIEIANGSYCITETVLFTPPVCNSFLTVPMRRSTPCPCCADDLPTMLYCAVNDKVTTFGDPDPLMIRMGWNSHDWPYPVNPNGIPVGSYWSRVARTRHDATWPRVIDGTDITWPAGSGAYYRDWADGGICKNGQGFQHGIFMALHCPHEDPLDRWRLHLLWNGCPDDPDTITNQSIKPDGPTSGSGSFGMWGNAYSETEEQMIHYTNLYAAGPPEGNLCGPVALSFTCDFGLFAGQVFNITQ